MKKDVFILFLLLITMQPANSQLEKFGHLIYTAPAGWKLEKYQNGVRMIITGPMPRELLTIDIMQPMNFSGTMEQALEKSYDETCAILQVTKMREVSGKHYNTKEPKLSFKGWEYIRCSGGIQVNNGTPYPDEYGLELFVIKVNNRFERIAIAKSRNNCDQLSRYYPSDRLSFHNAIEDFLFSISFDDLKEPVVSPGNAKGPGIVGVWRGLSISVGLAKPGAALGAELITKNLILFSNGQVFFGKYFPSEGLDGLNTWIKAENNRRDWGTYTFSNGKGVLKMPSGDIPVRMEDNTLILTTNKTDHGFIKINSVDDARFNGTYTLSEWNGKIPSVSFSSDGKFTDNGAIRILFHEYIDCLNPAVNPGSGTYEVKNHSLVFNYTDGRIIKIAFPGAGFDKTISAPSSLLLSFNQDELKRL